jgi:hypothetical protein
VILGEYCQIVVIPSPLQLPAWVVEERCTLHYCVW